MDCSEMFYCLKILLLFWKLKVNYCKNILGLAGLIFLLWEEYPPHKQRLHWFNSIVLLRVQKIQMKFSNVSKNYRDCLKIEHKFNSHNFIVFIILLVSSLGKICIFSPQNSQGKQILLSQKTDQYIIAFFSGEKEWMKN